MLIPGSVNPTWKSYLAKLKVYTVTIAGMVCPPLTQLTVDVTTTLTDLIIQIISDRANLLDSFVVSYATIVGALHRVVGIEFGTSRLA